MRCRSCGVDLPVDAAFCTQCGARVELGSTLGVGTDLPPAPHSDRPQPPPATPDDLSQTRELPRIDPAAAPPVVRRQPEPVRPVPVRPGPPDQPAQWEQSVAGPASEEGDRPSAHSRSSILAMVATFAVLTIIGTFALTRLVGSDDPRPTTQASASRSAAAEESGDAPASSAGPASPSASPTAAPSAPASQEVSPSASTSMPPQARRCSTSGTDAVATAYAGTERTSCEFAASVREAYRNAGTPGGATSLRAYSPVTKKWYSLSCDGGEPVRCTSTTNAIVLLAP